MHRRAVPWAVVLCFASFVPAIAEDSWCSRVAGGPSGARELAIDLSAAHAAARFFGPALRAADLDQALAAALDAPDALVGAGTGALTAYSGSVDSVCLVPTDNRGLGPARVQMIGRVALVRPGVGPVVVPLDALAVAVDLRHLPNREEVRAAIDAALSPALRLAPVPWQRRVREHEGLTPTGRYGGGAGSVYRNYPRTYPAPGVPTHGPVDRPLAFLTGGPMPPAAVEVAAAFRLQRRAWIIGEELSIAVAETRWQGVGQGPAVPNAKSGQDDPGRRRSLGKWGIAYRAMDLMAGGTRWPDQIAADVATADPVAELAGLPDRGIPPAIVPIPDNRARIQFHDADFDGQPFSLQLGALRAALITAHGALRLFFPYFDDVGDGIDARLHEGLDAAGNLPPADFSVLWRAVSRFTEVLHDGHVYVSPWYARSLAGLFPVYVDQVAGETVVVKSNAPGILPGDTLLTIDGQSVHDRYADAMTRTSAATEGFGYYKATTEAITALSGPTMVGVRDPAGVERAVPVQTAPFDSLQALATVASVRPAGWLSDLGAPDLYFINMSYFVTESTGEILAALSGAATARGLVVDMRGYPHVDHYRVARSLICNGFTSPIFRVPLVNSLDPSGVVERLYPLFPAGPPAFCGPLVLLVGPETVSAAENFSIMLVDARRARVVGRQSAATNGNVTGLSLPGGFNLIFTGMKVLHRDRSRFHGIGIVPHVVSQASAADYAAGTDRVLLDGIAALREMLASPCPLDPDQDSDGDGVCGQVDDCPSIPNPDQGDADGDGLGDACDACPLDRLNDSDRDGHCGGADLCPEIADPDQVDSDGDGRGDRCDNCADAANAGQSDIDGDGAGDVCDRCPSDPLDDADADGWCADRDNCPAIPNPGQDDADGDGFGDLCDRCPADGANDADGDGACADRDNCLGVTNPDQADTDGDGRGDRCDNCPGVHNPDQADGNTDGAGDACQPILEIVAILEDGGPELEATVRARDPGGDPITGTIRILDPRQSVTLADFAAAPGCGVALPPESVPGMGIAYAIAGGGRVLGDADLISSILAPAACHDGQPDYMVAPGPCDNPAAPPDVLYDLSLISTLFPGPICIHRIDGSASWEYQAGVPGATLTLLGEGFVVQTAPFPSPALPAEVPLAGMVPLNVYRLEIVVTDGATPPVLAYRDFLYQGEGVLQLLAPPALARPGT